MIALPARSVVVAMLLTWCSHALALPPLPAMACPLIEAAEAPKLDGNLDEAVWSEGDLQTRFYRYYFGLDRPLEFRLLTDGKWLYVGLTALETGIAEKDVEVVNIAIAPHKTSDQFVSFSVRMNAQGITKSDPQFGEGDRWKAAFRQHADRWVAEIAVRAELVFGGELIRGKVFDFNLSRTRLWVAEDSFDVYQQWSNTGTSSGTRYRFGWNGDLFRQCDRTWRPRHRGRKWRLRRSYV